MTTAIWMSKSARAAARPIAHLVGTEGPACAQRSRPLLFTSVWEPLRSSDHLCAACRRIEPRHCTCAACAVAPPPASHIRLAIPARRRVCIISYVSLAIAAARARRARRVLPLGRLVAIARAAGVTLDALRAGGPGLQRARRNARLVLRGAGWGEKMAARFFWPSAIARAA